MFVLKQGATYNTKLGPFVDKGDGVAYEVGMSAAMGDAATGVRLSKNGAAFADRSEATDPAYDAFGYYLVKLDATDTNTVGTLKVIFGDAAVCLPCEANYQVLEPATYDALFADAATAVLPDTAGVTELLTRVPDATAGQNGGLTICGSNAAATFANLTVSGTSALGAVTATTIGASGAVTAASLTMSGVLQAATIVSTGTTTLNALTVTNATTHSGTTTYTGAVTFKEDTLLEKKLTVTGATALTGAVTAPAGITANITGNLVGTVSTLTTYTGNTPQTGDSFAIVNGAHGLVSIQDDVDEILIDTAVIGALGAGLTALAQATELAKVPKSDSNVTWNATALASLQTEANDALVANHLDDLGTDWLNGGRLDLLLDAATAPSAATVADAVWDEVLHVAHEAADSASVLLQASGGAADPWLTALPGAYGAGTAGRLIGRSLPDVVAGNATGLALVGSTMEVNDKTGFAIGVGGIDDTAFAAGALNAAAIAANAIGSSELDATAGTELGAAVLAAAAATPIASNLKEVNDITLVGNGAGVPWGPI